MIRYFCLIFFIALSLQADEESAFVEIARHREYASGPDESDLIVQPILKKLPTKKKKQIISEPINGF